MKNYEDIEEFLLTQEERIQVGLQNLKTAKRIGDESLKNEALAMISGAKKALEEGRKVLDVIAVENGRYMDERLEAMGSKSEEELRKQQANILAMIEGGHADFGMGAEARKEQLKAINRELNKIQTISNKHFDNVNRIMNEYEEVDVFYKYNKETGIYTQKLLLTKEQAEIYRNVEPDIRKAFSLNNEQEAANMISSMFAFYPELKQIAPTLLVYTNSESEKYATNALEKYMATKIPFENTIIDGSEDVSEKDTTTSKESVFSKISNFAKNKITAFNVKRAAVVAGISGAVSTFFSSISKAVEGKVTGVKNVRFKAARSAVAALGIATALTSPVAILTACNNKTEDKNTKKVEKQVDEENVEANVEEIKEDSVVGTSKFENQFGNVSYEEFISTLNIYDNKANTTGLKAEQVAALGYGLNVDYLSEETTEQLKQNGVISENPMEVFMNIIEARDNIDNNMHEYDKNTDKNKEELFNDISSLATDSESEEQIYTIFDSIRTVYTGTKEDAKAELDKFVEFMNENEIRSEKDNYGFNYSDLNTDGKLATFIYAPNFLEKLRQFDYDQDMIENLQYQFDNVSDFLRSMGYECIGNETVNNINNSEGGMNYNTGKVYGIEVNPDGSIKNMGRAVISGGKTIVEQLGGYSEENITGNGKNSSTTTTGSGKETVENVTGDGDRTHTEVEEGKDEKVEDVTGDGNHTNTEVEEGKDETVEDVTPDGDRTHTEVEDPKDEEIVEGDKHIENNEKPSNDTVVDEGDQDEIVEDVTPDGDRTHTEVEDPDDEQIVDEPVKATATKVKVENVQAEKEAAAKKAAEEAAKKAQAEKEAAAKKAAEEAAKKAAYKEAVEAAAKEAQQEASHELTK